MKRNGYRVDFPIWVIPGSSRGPLPAETFVYWDLHQTWGERPQDLPAFKLVTRSGWVWATWETLSYSRAGRTGTSSPTYFTGSPFEVLSS